MAKIFYSLCQSIEGVWVDFTDLIIVERQSGYLDVKFLICSEPGKLKKVLSYLAQAPEGPIFYNGDIILVEINMIQLPGNKILSFLLVQLTSILSITLLPLLYK